MTNLLLRLFGFGKAVDALDGAPSKTYMGALGLILSGASSVLTGMAHVTGDLLAAKGGAAYLSIAKGLYAGNADTALLVAGAALISKGIATIGQRHATAVASLKK